MKSKDIILNEKEDIFLKDKDICQNKQISDKIK